MTQLDNVREASATIRGYIYQFDATIREILNSNNDTSCTIEDVEDFDLHSPDLSSYFQCKYYAAQKLIPSTFRDAILPMLKNYVGLDKDERNNKRYYLYGYFKETSYEDSTISLEALKKILVRREKIKNGSGGERYKSINIQEEIGATDDDLEGFILKFSLNLCDEYESHKTQLINELAATTDVSVFECEKYVYPSALTLVSLLACKKMAKERTITKNDFLQKIKPNQVLYSLWALREKNKQAYCKVMRSRYFTCRNIDSEARFFILECPASVSEVEILQTLKTIRKKWSSHTVRRKPDNERYAPYIYLRNASPEKFINIKRYLHEKGISFVDGYPYQGSSFSLSAISQQQTFQNAISLRFINSEEDLHNCILNLNEQISIFQFFYDTTVTFNDSVFHVCIPISSTDMIAEIV
jgi:hypothetical protein